MLYYTLAKILYLSDHRSPRIREQARQMVCPGTGYITAGPTKARCSGAAGRSTARWRARHRCPRGWRRCRRDWRRCRRDWHRCRRDWAACPRRRRREHRRRRCRPVRWPGPLPHDGRRHATSPSPAAPMASSCLAPHSCAPNPQAIKVFAIPPFLPNSSDDVTISTRTATDIGYVIA